MFPPFITRFADAALELADALLAPQAYSDHLDSPHLTGDDDVRSHAPEAPQPRSMDAFHPHREPLRSRAVGSSRRRPGAVQRPTQPCTSPLPLQRPGEMPRSSTPALP